MAKASLTLYEQDHVNWYGTLIKSWKAQAEKLPKEELEAMHEAIKHGWPMEIDATKIYHFALAFPCLVKFDATKYKDYKMPEPKAGSVEEEELTKKSRKKSEFDERW